MSKLLNKPLKAFTLYALVVLASSIPVYYIVVDYIWMDELDDHNRIIKQRIEKRFDKAEINENELSTVLELWSVLQPGTKLVPANASQVQPDSVYRITREHDHSGEMETDRFRGLSTYVQINGKDYYHLTIETNVEEADDTLLAIALVTFSFFSLLVIGFIILNRRIAKKIWQPFHNTLDKVKTFDLIKDKSIQFKKSNIEEFEELNDELSKLITKNISVFNLQKTFIENASHELQTPLAVLKSKIEILLQSEKLTLKQFEIINSINIPLARVSRTNKNLLLLAKIENNQFLASEEFDLAELLRENISLLGDYIDAKNIEIIVNLTQNVSVICNKALCEILISNLLTNAITHNFEKGKIIIELSDNGLSISNTGGRELNKERIFKRFVAASPETTNSGLGLAIVREVCNAFQWDIDYTFQNNLHSFSLQF